MSPSSLSTPSQPDRMGMGSSPATMAGSPGEGGEGTLTGSPEAGPDQQMVAATEQVRTIEMQLKSLAQSYPQAAASVRKAVDSVRSVLKSIVASGGGKETEAPQG